MVLSVATGLQLSLSSSVRAHASIEDLSRVEQPGGIERLLDLRMTSKLLSPICCRSHAFFARPTPCSPVIVPPSSSVFFAMSVERMVDARHFVRVALVGEERRVQVAVAHVTERADLQVRRSARSRR